MINITDLKDELTLTPLLRLGFRPFFLLGSAFAVFAMSVWLLSLSGLVSINPLNGLFWWHSHEMLFGFVSAIIAGFLLTAVQNWTGVKSVKGKPLLFLVGLWLVARLVILFDLGLPISFIIIIDCAFLPAVGVCLALPLMRVKQTRNMIFLPVLGLMTVANIMTYLPQVGLDASFNTRGLHAMTLLTTLLVALIGGRVIPMFTANGTNTPKVLPNKWLEIASLSSLFIIFVFFIAGLTHFTTVLGTLCVFSACMFIGRSLRWRPWITLNVPLVWILHLSMLFIPIGLCLMAIHFIFNSLSLSTAIHSLTIGVISGMIIAMMARVSLGHTGRVLTPHPIMTLAFTFIIISTLGRSVMVALFPELSLKLWLISGGLWTLSFAIFVIIYSPILSNPRIDGRPG